MNDPSLFRAALGTLGSVASLFSPAEPDAGTDLFTSIMDHLPSGIAIKDENLRYLYVNRYLKAVFGEESWEGRRASDIYAGDPAVTDIDDEDRRALGGSALDVFLTIPDKNGVARRFRVTKFPIAARDGGRLLGYSVTDISDLVKAQDDLARAVAEREMLLKEVYHRVKNNLATVASLIRLGSDGIDDPRAIIAFEDSYRRIDSLALLHEELYGSEDLSELDFGRYLRSLSERVFSSYAPSSRVSLRVEAEDLKLPMNVAVPLALIANELVTNSLKYAFPECGSGSVKVRLSLSANEALLEVSDDGVGLPAELRPESAKSLGFVLVHQLARQVGGRAEFGPGPGAVCRVRFPLPGKLDS